MPLIYAIVVAHCRSTRSSGAAFSTDPVSVNGIAGVGAGDRDNEVSYIKLLLHIWHDIPSDEIPCRLCPLQSWAARCQQVGSCQAKSCTYSAT